MTASSEQPEDAAASREVLVPWRGLGGRGLSAGALIFAGLMLYLSVREGKFEGIHRSVMVAVALGMLYFVASRLVNVTQLVVRDAQLWVRHGPLPLRSRVRAPLDQIDGLRCDNHGRRLLLRTTQGEDVILLEDVPLGTLNTLRTSIVERLKLPLI